MFLKYNAVWLGVLILLSCQQSIFLFFYFFIVGIKKKITAVSKLKDCELAGKWKRSIVNHVYWSAVSTPDGDGDVMVAKFRSMTNHIRNIHVHEDHSALFPQCAHGDDYPQREWMNEGK